MEKGAKMAGRIHKKVKVGQQNFKKAKIEYKNIDNNMIIIVGIKDAINTFY